LIPEKTKSGRTSFRIRQIARFTQSVGVPSTTHERSPVFTTRRGRVSVSAWEVALCSRSGATTQVSKPAAFEGTLLGVPSIAFSLDCRKDGGAGPDFSEAERIAEEVIRLALSRPMAEDILWNVNIPEGRPTGIRATRMGRRRYGESVVEKVDPRGRPYYWIGGSHVDTHSDGSDLTTVAEGLVSVTPLHLDLTAYRALEDLSARLEGSRANGADRS
ncbi:partial 5'-nucleotidase SurE, partial [Gammaproteobacteria bacterium]